MNKDTKFNTALFYTLIGIAASLGFFLLLYWGLRLNSSIASLIGNTYYLPLYFWPYVILTFAAIVLFGVNAALFVYRWRKWGPPQIKKQGATGAGSLMSVAASACPVCGATILSAIGIAGGLAAFPLGGLELKAVSLGLLALPIWLMRKDMKKLESDCEKGICPALRDASFKEKTDRPWLSRLMMLVFVLVFVGWGMLKTDPAFTKVLASDILNQKENTNTLGVPSIQGGLLEEVTAKVLPERGFQSKVQLSDSVVKLVANGVIDQTKFEAIYQERGGFPPELKDVLVKPSYAPILLTGANAQYYVNLLWPLGLANYMESNKSSPVNGKSLFNFASTGGWDLGKEENGGAYFNKFKIVELTPEQEVLVTKIAQNTYRPCCDNSTFFQDCNHGSALLGLLQLGATQGLTEDELYKEALAFNSFWFPNNYIQTALYFKVVKNIDWEKVDAKTVMGKDFSTGSGWYKNVSKEIERLDLMPKERNGSSCGV